MHNAPANGELLFNGIPIIAGQNIPVDELGNLEFHPQANDFGTNYASFDFSVVDGNANPVTSASSNRMQIDVTAVNDAPEVVAENVEVAENNGLFAFNADAADVDDTTLTFSLDEGVADNDLFEIDAATGVVRFADVPDFFNPLDGGQDNSYRVGVTVTDAAGATGSEFVFVTVTEVNQAPIVETTVLNQFENQNPTHQIETFDREGQDLTFEFVGTENDNELFVLNSSTGQLTLVETPDFEAGDHDFVVEVKATDSGGLSDVQDITVSIDNVVERVELVDMNVTLDRGSLSNVSFLGESQVLAEEVTYRLVQEPTSGSVVLNADGSFDFESDSTSSAIFDTFVVEAERGGETTEATITVQQAAGPPVQVTNDNTSAETNSDTQADESLDGDADNNNSNVQEDQSQGPVQERDIANSDDPGNQNVGPGGTSGTTGSGADTVSNENSGLQVSEDSELGLNRFDYSTYVYAGSVGTELLTEQLVSGIGQIRSRSVGRRAG